MIPHYLRYRPWKGFVLLGLAITADIGLVPHGSDWRGVLTLGAIILVHIWVYGVEVDES